MATRRLLLIACGTLLLAAVAGSALVLAGLDTARYRAALEYQLSSAWQTTVRIGDLRLAWHRGPVLQCSELEIGTAPSIRPQLQLRQLYLQPKLLPLLFGRLSCRRLILDQPRFRQPWPPKNGSAPDFGELLDKLVRSVRVRHLSISDGLVELVDEHGESMDFSLSGVELQARNLFESSPTKLRVRATLQRSGQRIPLALDGRFQLAEDPRHWRRTEGRFTLHLDAFEPGRLWSPAKHLPNLTGRATWHISGAGSPATGLHLNLQIKGEDLRMAWPDRPRDPAALSMLSLSTRWISTPSLDQWQDLSISLDNQKWSGHLSHQHQQPEPRVAVHLQSDWLDWAQLRRWLPEPKTWPLLARLRNDLQAGKLQLQASLDGPLARLQPDTLHEHLEGSLEFRDGSLQLTGSTRLEQLRAILRWQEGRLALTEGSARLLDTPLRFQGSLAALDQAVPTLALAASWLAPSGKLAARLTDHAEIRRAVQGIVPINLSLHGPLDALAGELDADLAACRIQWRNGFDKFPGTPATLRAEVAVQGERIALRNGLLQLPDLDLKLQGWITKRLPGPLSLQADLTGSNLKSLPILVPALADFPLAGKARLTAQLSRTASTPLTLQGNLRLQQVQVAIPGLRAPLHHLNGELRLSETGLEFQQLQGQLGRSNITLGGLLDFRPGRESRLQVAAPAMNAGDLLFPSTTAVLRDLKGTVLITADRLSYQDVRLRLKNSSLIRVDGHTQLTARPVTDLTARAERAVIEEVLELWEGEPESDGEETDQAGRVTVRATVDEARFGPLNFQKVSGTVHHTGQQLSIHPLEFRLGPGRGHAQILVDEAQPAASRLSVSGHLQQVDAEILLRDLLQRRGLATGALTADFYLSGPVSASVIEQGNGQLRLQIRSGVLRQFPFLSKVFSLLNVAQLFALQWPDMARDGMPFQEIGGSFELRQGRLRTEDLLVKSPAMNLSLVGAVDLPRDELDLVLGVQPFGTLDKVVSRIPVAGWILAGKEKALITAHFRVTGNSADPDVDAIPITSVSEKVLGIFRRVLGLPGKMVSDVGQLFQTASPPPQKEPRGEP